MQLGARIDETGVLTSDEAGLVFRRELGGRYRLELRPEVVESTRRIVRLVGTYVGGDVVDVNAIEPI